MTKVGRMNSVNSKKLRVGCFLRQVKNLLKVKDNRSVFLGNVSESFSEIVESLMKGKLFLYGVNHKRQKIKHLSILKLCVYAAEYFTKMRLHRSNKRRILLRDIVFPCIINAYEHNYHIGLKVDAIPCKPVINVICTVAGNALYVNLYILAEALEAFFQLQSIDLSAFDFMSHTKIEFNIGYTIAYKKHPTVFSKNYFLHK